MALCGIKFFYEHTLHQELTTLTFFRPPREKKLPVIVSIEEARTILAHLKLLRYRVCLITSYSCGLRLQEGTHLQVPEIDSARMLVHVRSGKGAKDRYVPLPCHEAKLVAYRLVDENLGAKWVNFRTQ
jgi:integrase/recombinase XerD